MTAFRAHKVVATLPVQLDPSTVYFVRVREGFDLHVTDQAGVAKSLNTAAASIDGGAAASTYGGGPYAAINGGGA